jgi:large subunit ribosomal protein L15
MSMIHEITAIAPRKKRSQRKGRGESSGRGKTCGRGTKGSGARGGGPHWKPGHEGGQTTIIKRLPKRGFSNENFERRFHIVNLGELERFVDGATVDAAALIGAGLVPDTRWPVKVLGEGKFTRKLTILAAKFSRSAYAMIQKLGGTAQNPKGEPFAYPKPKFRPKPRPKQEAQAKGSGKKKPKAEAPAAAEAAPSAPAEQKSE